MANQDVRVSALQSASTLSTEDLALATVVDELSETGYTSKKITEGAKASQYLEAFTFANLNTTAKTIVGAINEAATTGGSDEFIIHMTDTTVTETAADIIDAFDNGSEIWLESQITGEALKARLPLLAYISGSNSLVLRFSGITYSNNRYRYCDVQMIRNPKQILGKQAINVTFAVIDDATTSASSVWSSQKTASELAGKAEIDDTATDTETTWSSSRIASLLPTESASGAVASFETPLTLPLVSHNVTIEPVQAGTGDPSPSNVRPISGWSEMNVKRTGINLNDGLTEEGTIDLTDGTDKAQSGYLRSKNYLHIKGGVNYYGKADGNPASFVVCFYDKNLNYIGYLATAVVRNAVFTAPSGAYFFRYYHTDGDFRISINYPSTTTTNEPYTSEAEEVTIALGQTVYGGELDVKNGVLRVTHGNTDLGSLTWTKYTSYTYPFFSSNLSSLGIVTATSGQINIDCEMYKPIGALTLGGSGGFGNNAHNLEICHQANGTQVMIQDSNYSTVEDFITAITGSKIVFKLATPVEITLTPEQINTLKGVNNIWADTGDTAVEYRADIQKYIDKKIAEAVGGNRSLSLMKSAPVETKEETKQEEQEGGENVDR